VVNSWQKSFCQAIGLVVFLNAQFSAVGMQMEKRQTELMYCMLSSVFQMIKKLQSLSTQWCVTPLAAWYLLRLSKG